jgi:RHS repeat-associated protein
MPSHGIPMAIMERPAPHGRKAMRRKDRASGMEWLRRGAGGGNRRTLTEGSCIFRVVEKSIPKAYSLLETPSGFVSHDGEFYTSPFFFSRLAAVFIQPEKCPVTDVIPARHTTPPKKGLIGKKSTSCHLIGARYYDAELGVWMSIDPAGQYANPYGYGKNPAQMVDPDGEWLHILAGAIIGAGVGVYTSYKAGHPIFSLTTLAYAGGGALSGAATAATAGLAGPLITGAVGSAAIGVGASAGVAGFAGTVASGAVVGGLGGAISYSATVSVGFGTGDIKHMTPDQFWTGFAVSSISGAAMGGVTSGVSFGLSSGVRDAAQQNIGKFQSRFQVGPYGPEAQLRASQARFNERLNRLSSQPPNEYSLGDNDFVCRGGSCTADRFENGSSPTANNPLHCTLCGITPAEAEQLFTPTTRNPSIGN